MVPIIGETAAQAIEPIPYQASGVNGRLVIGTFGFGATTCAHAGNWAPITVAISTIAAVATRRIRKPPARCGTQVPQAFSRDAIGTGSCGARGNG